MASSSQEDVNWQASGEYATKAKGKPQKQEMQIGGPLEQLPLSQTPVEEVYTYRSLIHL